MSVAEIKRTIAALAPREQREVTDYLLELQSVSGMAPTHGEEQPGREFASEELLGSIPLGQGPYTNERVREIMRTQCTPRTAGKENR